MDSGDSDDGGDDDDGDDDDDSDVHGHSECWWGVLRGGCGLPARCLHLYFAHSSQ